MWQLFKGNPLDIYVHWLILILGIGVLLAGAAVLISCRSFASFLKLNVSQKSGRRSIYSRFYKYHSYYWVAFWLILFLHLMVTVTHVGLPEAPFYLAHQVVFITSLVNIALLIVILFSCKTIAGLIRYFGSKNPLDSKAYKRFYKYHSYFWIILLISIGTHMVFGLIHAMNT